MTCILCDGREFEELAAKLRHDVPRRVVRCKACRLVSLENPTADNVDYTDTTYRKLHGPVIGKESSAQEMFDISLPFQAARAERIAGFLTPDAAVLEVGSSTGHFLHTIRPRVGRVVGIELNPSHVAFARDRCGLEIHDRPLGEEALGGPFDLIVMFQVLEHIAQPFEFLSLVRRYLKPGGTLHVEVPNIDDVLVSTFDIPEFRAFYYRAPHIYYYAASTLVRLMDRAGFRGEIHYAQTYSLFNHAHWLLTRSPQRDQTSAARAPRIQPPSAERAADAEALEAWFREIDEAYRRRLMDTGLAELVSFTGSMKDA